MRIAAAHGIELAAIVDRLADESAGGADLGVVMVHGLGGSKDDFQDWLQGLSGRFRAVAFDLRGHGESAHPDDPDAYSLAHMERDVVAVADGFGFDRFVLVGHSVGGMVARRLALSAVSDRIAALILLDTSHGPMPGLNTELAEAAAWIAVNHGMSELRDRMTERDPLGTPAHQRLVRDRLGYEAYCEAKWAALSPAMYASMLVEIAGQPDQLAELSTLQVPTLVMVGEQDEPFLADCQRMASVIPQASLAVIPDAGHAPQLEAPQASLNITLEFLTRVLAPRP